MNAILFSTFAFLCLISLSRQLFCSTNCPIFHIEYSNSFIEPTQYNSCFNNTSVQICKGQIIAYYKGKNFPQYINYTFGTLGDASEAKNEDNINTYVLANLTRYQILINAKSEETKIITDIYCTTENECALVEIKNLFVKYNHQINPFYALKSFIYVDPSPKKLSCFNMSNSSNEQCAITYDNPVCISLSSSNDLKQGCSFASDIEIYEEFILPSPDIVELTLNNENVKCNKDNCNNNEILEKIQRITRGYADGTINGCEKTQQRKNQIFYIVVLMVFIFRNI